VTAVRVLALVEGDGEARGVFASRDFVHGDFIARFEGAETAQRTRMSLQFGPERHVEPAEDHPLRFLNHACDPNAVFQDRDLFAAKPIASDEEITIDYNVHEDELSHPFECGCGSPACVGWVRGRRVS
jgi:hypothetical protein